MWRLSQIFCLTNEFVFRSFFNALKFLTYIKKWLPDNFTMKCTGPLDSAGFIDMIQVCPEMRSRTSHTSLFPHH